MYSEFKQTVLMLLTKAVQRGKYDILVGHVISGIIRHTQLFQKYEAREDEYRRAFHYVMQMRPVLITIGWELKDINGQKHFSLTCPAAREKDYTKCNGCDKRVECLLDPLHQ